MYYETIERIELDSFEKFTTYISNNSYKKFCYRGHHHENYFLRHSLQRAFENLEIPSRWWNAREKASIESFRSKSHLFLGHIPNRNDDLEWLSIMQHFGAPTRLLDFTFSPYVALFFAAERITSDFTVYEIDLLELKKLNNSLGVRYNENQLQSLLITKDNNINHPIVVPYEPKYQNERLIAQQGLFLFSNQLDGKLDKVLNEYNSASPFIKQYVFNMDKSDVKKLITKLKTMNIDNLRLFPGIEGMAKSQYLSLLEPSTYIH